MVKSGWFLRIESKDNEAESNEKDLEWDIKVLFIVGSTEMADIQ